MHILEDHAAQAAPRVVYADLDGTLTRDGSLFKGTRGPSLATSRALVALARAGVEVVPTSGRTVAQLRVFARAIGSRTFIAELGSVIGYGGGDRLITTLPRSAWSRASAIRESGAPEALFARYAGLGFHDPWDAGREHTVLLRGGLDVSGARKLLAETHPGLSVIDNGEIGAGVHAYHILSHGVDKGAAIAKDQEERGIPREACVAIGDSVGDFACAREVASCFLLGFDRSAEGPENGFAVPDRYGEGFEAAVSWILAADRRG